MPRACWRFKLFPNVPVAALPLADTPQRPFLPILAPTPSTPCLLRLLPGWFMFIDLRVGLDRRHPAAATLHELERLDLAEGEGRDGMITVGSRSLHRRRSRRIVDHRSRPSRGPVHCPQRWGATARRLKGRADHCRRPAASAGRGHGCEIRSSMGHGSSPTRLCRGSSSTSTATLEAGLRSRRRAGRCTRACRRDRVVDSIC